VPVTLVRAAGSEQWDKAAVTITTSTAPTPTFEEEGWDSCEARVVVHAEELQEKESGVWAQFGVRIKLAY